MTTGTATMLTLTPLSQAAAVSYSGDGGGGGGDVPAPATAVTTLQRLTYGTVQKRMASALSSGRNTNQLALNVQIEIYSEEINAFMNWFK